MKKIMILMVAALAVVACNSTAPKNSEEWADTLESAAKDVAEKSVELYEEAAPVVEQAAMDAAAKSVELYEDAAPVVEDAAMDAAEKSIELYEKSKK